MLNLRGLSLVELLVSLVLGSLLMVAFLRLLAAVSTHYYHLQQAGRLVNELQTIALVVDNHVRMAGYDGLAIARAKDNRLAPSPFSTPMTISQHNEERTKSCILFSADINRNGILSKANPRESFGYRLRNNALETRMANATCTTGYWQDVSDPKFVQITQFEARIVKPKIFANTHAHIRFTLSGRLKRQQEITHTLVWITPLRNKNA